MTEETLRTLTREQADKIIGVIKQDATLRAAYWNPRTGDACVIGGLAKAAGCDMSVFVGGRNMGELTACLLEMQNGSIQDAYGEEFIPLEIPNADFDDLVGLLSTNQNSISGSAYGDAFDATLLHVRELIANEYGLDAGQMQRLQSLSDRHYDTEGRRATLIEEVNSWVKED